MTDKISFCVHDTVGAPAKGPVEVAAVGFTNEDSLVCLALGERGFKVWQRELDAAFPSNGPITVTVLILDYGLDVRHDLDKGLTWLDRLEQVCAKSDNGLIQVGGAGSGPTEMSRKVRLLARATKPQQQASTSEHTVTVPRSLVEEHNGKLWMPRWAARRTANERLPPQHWRETVVYQVDGLNGQCMVPPDVQAGIEEVRQALRGGLEAALPRARAAIAESLARRAAEEAASQAQAPARAETARKAAEVQAELARKAEAASAKAKANREKLPALIGVKVAWVDYVGTSRNKVRVLREADGCTVRISGERVYITLPNGTELVKTRQTVQVNDEDLPETHSVRRARERIACEKVCPG